jgi:hypothetical protein
MKKAARRLVSGMSNTQRFVEISREEAAYEICATLQPNVKATIFSQETLASFLSDFSTRLIERQAQWLVEDEDEG